MRNICLIPHSSEIEALVFKGNLINQERKAKLTYMVLYLSGQQTHSLGLLTLNWVTGKITGKGASFVCTRQP